MISWPFTSAVLWSQCDDSAIWLDDLWNHQRPTDSWPGLVQECHFFPEMPSAWLSPLLFEALLANRPTEDYAWSVGPTDSSSMMAPPLLTVDYELFLRSLRASFSWSFSRSSPRLRDVGL
jgi:hypothetical protein